MAFLIPHEIFRLADLIANFNSDDVSLRDDLCSLSNSAVYQKATYARDFLTVLTLLLACYFVSFSFSAG